MCNHDHLEHVAVKVSEQWLSADPQMALHLEAFLIRHAPCRICKGTGYISDKETACPICQGDPWENILEE